MSDVRERVPAWTMGDRLRKSREKVGLKQAEMAIYLRKSRQAVGKWEDGKVVPDISILRDWALKTDVPVEWLESGVGNQGGFAQLGFLTATAVVALGAAAVAGGYLAPAAALGLLYITDSEGEHAPEPGAHLDAVDISQGVAGLAEAHLLRTAA